MSDVTVRALTEDEWSTYRATRLAALQDSPDAFVSRYDEEVTFEEDFWRIRMLRSTRLLAERDGESVGIISVGDAKPIHSNASNGDDDSDEVPQLNDHVAELFGMWVEPASRGTGVAWSLMDAASREAKRQGRTHLMLWVVVENGRAVAFYSSYGFRPSDSRRPMRTDESLTEMAMVLPVNDDPGSVPNSLPR